MIDYKIISIIVSVSSLEQVRMFLENIQRTALHHKQIEIILKLSPAHSETMEILANEINEYDFTLKHVYTADPNDYQACFALADNSSYFVALFKDILRFVTHGWDKIITAYVNYYPDDVFWLKLSANKYHYYYQFQECSLAPESYPIMTRNWLALSEGIGQTSIPEAWQQCLDYHLGQMEGINDIPGIFRSIPVVDIMLENRVEKRAMSHDDIRAFWHLNTAKIQQEFRRLATLLYAYIWAINEKWNDFEIEQNEETAIITITNGNGFKKEFYYHVSSRYIMFENFLFLKKLSRSNDHHPLLEGFNYINENHGWRIPFNGTLKKMMLKFAK